MNLTVKTNDSMLRMEPSDLVINVWGEMLLAIISWESYSLLDDGKTIMFEDLDFLSFPYREITEDNLSKVLEKSAELALVGFVPYDEEDDRDWDEMGHDASASFTVDGDEVATTTTCKFVIYEEKKKFLAPWAQASFAR